ncbi:MAG: hypothetical protein AAGU05_17255, partial [Anaerolineaceae bacterium]
MSKEVRADLGIATAQANQAVQFLRVIGVDGRLNVPGTVRFFHFMRAVLARTQDCAARGEDVREVGGFQGRGVVVKQT